MPKTVPQIAASRQLDSTRGQHVSDDLAHAGGQSTRCVEAQDDRLHVLRIGGKKGIFDILGRCRPDGSGDRD
jgi:hypothetical protein